MTDSQRDYDSVIAFIAADIWTGDPRCNQPPSEMDIVRERERQVREYQSNAKAKEKAV